MLDITKLLSGLFQNGGGEAPGKQLPQGMIPGQTPGINPEAPPMQAIKPEVGQTPGINPNQAPPPLTSGMPVMAPEVKPGINWRERMLGGLKGLQAAQSQQQQAPVAAPMDMEQIKQLQFAHRQSGGIIPRGRY